MCDYSTHGARAVCETVCVLLYLEIRFHQRVGCCRNLTVAFQYEYDLSTVVLSSDSVRFAPVNLPFSTHDGRSHEARHDLYPLSCFLELDRRPVHHLTLTLTLYLTLTLGRLDRSAAQRAASSSSPPVRPGSHRLLLGVEVWRTRRRGTVRK